VIAIGLTGGIGSGKTTVAARLEALGAAVIDDVQGLVILAVVTGIMAAANWSSSGRRPAMTLRAH